MSGGTRLDRLILLLESGSTPSVRLTAARQLGAIARVRVAHGSVGTGAGAGARGIKEGKGTEWRGTEGEWSEVMILVAKILPHLQSRSFETRTAAATALGMISSNVGIWDPQHASSSISSIVGDPEVDMSSPLDNFDLNALLSTHPILLSSSGNEYTPISALQSNQTHEERVKTEQASLLKSMGMSEEDGKELGVDLGEELGAGGDPDKVVSVPTGGGLPPPHFKTLSGNSLRNPQNMSTLSPTHTTENTASQAIPPNPVVIAPEEGMSARERNKLKRKRKAEGKSGPAPPTPSFSAVASPKITATPSAKREMSDAEDKIVEEDDGRKRVKLEDGTSDDNIGDSSISLIDRSLQSSGGQIEPTASTSSFVVGYKGKAEGASLDGRLKVEVGKWPWGKCVDMLVGGEDSGLKSPSWETRHGAALGLKEILKLQGGNGGKIAGLTMNENAELNRHWQEDVASNLLSVLVLDRFGDYISDQTIAPVRETTAQALAYLLPFMSPRSIVSISNVLFAMIDQNGSPPSLGLDSKYEKGPRGSSKHTSLNGKGKGKEESGYAWQVRHSGLLGLKYLVVVQGGMMRGTTPETLAKEEVKMEGDYTISIDKQRLDGTQSLLKGVVDAALLGLRDKDDDVRSTAAAALTPIADALVKDLPDELEQVVAVLWECLADLQDDLSSSIGGVMDLLARLLASPEVLQLMQGERMGSSLSSLIPRLFPFFRHAISTVRLSVLNTILVFLELPSIPLAWADSRVLRLLFQNLVVEERPDIRTATTKCWKACLAYSSQDDDRLLLDAGSHLSKWFAILMTPIGIPIESSLFWSAKVSLSGQAGYIHNVDKAMLAQDLSLVKEDSITRVRVAGAEAFGYLMSVWPTHTRAPVFRSILLNSLHSSSAFNRFLSATIISEYASTSFTTLQLTSEGVAFEAELSGILSVLLQGEALASYDELRSISLKMHSDCQALYNAMLQQGKVPASKIPPLPLAPFDVTHAIQAVSVFRSLLPFLGKGLRKTVLPALEMREKNILISVGYFNTMKATYDRRVFAAVSAAVVALRTIPPKITPLIRSLTNSIKEEENIDIQARSAAAIAAFIDICSAPNSSVKSDPTGKIVKNLCTFLCQDTNRTPLFSQAKVSRIGIMSLELKPARGLAVKEAKEVESDEILAAQLVYRGAQLALSELALRFGPTLLQRVPMLWKCMSSSLLEVYASGDSGTADSSSLEQDDNVAQGLLDCLSVLPIGAAKLGTTLQHHLTALFSPLALAIRSRFPVIRYAASKAFAALCDIVPSEGLRHLIESVIPFINDPLNESNRRGPIEVISHIVELLDVKILPYVIFLVVPVLGRMSDSDDEVRLVATNTFASLIKLVPLEAGLPDPPGFSSDLLARRQHEREFLAQLLDGSKVEEYKIPIDISIELRQYQRDGVSWLAFLAKYQLHGLLCDDMGLGKTLQSICILASKHHERAERHLATKSLDSVHLPSLIVCPPTLTGHWKHEIKTYAKNLRCLIYTGVKADRERLAATLSDYDAVIMSYDIVRNDIDTLGQQEWHYCILDEGHIIKNGKTKLTKAVKSIRAIHRLLLSGTPIQNNVLELWSLFDFLMPGFLGSEKAFNDRFGKPIAASRDAKSSSKEQEAGALALEALHKQVLPFLLRRLKEDVLDDLPPKIIQDYYCELSPLQKQLYDDFSKSQAKEAVDGELSGSGGKSDGGKPQHVFQALQYLRKLVNHPVLVIKPEIHQHQLIVAKIQQNGGSLRDVENAPKLQALRQILLDCGIGTPDADSIPDPVSQHRVLIFCQLKQMLDIIENDLFKVLMPSVTYMRMDGATDVSKRHAVVQTFNGDPSIDCLLLTTHVGGLGLNLTGADTVIFVEHDWNPMKDLQAMDRAHRLGQKKVVNVYRLIMRGTLEEKIMGLQRFKLNIASSVVTQQNSDLASLGTDQILDLFNVSSADAPSVADRSDRPVGQKAILEGLGELQPEDEYQDLDFASFTASM